MDLLLLFVILGVIAYLAIVGARLRIDPAAYRWKRYGKLVLKCLIILLAGFLGAALLSTSFSTALAIAWLLAALIAIALHLAEQLGGVNPVGTNVLLSPSLLLSPAVLMLYPAHSVAGVLPNGFRPNLPFVPRLRVETPE